MVYLTKDLKKRKIKMFVCHYKTNLIFHITGRKHSQRGKYWMKMKEEQTVVTGLQGAKNRKQWEGVRVWGYKPNHSY